MYVCEHEFELPDPNDEKYSFSELDFYAWIPFKYRKKDGNHRLSLRKNLVTNEFELYKYFHANKPIEIVLKSTNLQEVLNESNKLWNYYHSNWARQEREHDKICTHEYPEQSMLCETFKKRSERRLRTPESRTRVNGVDP